MSHYQTHNNFSVCGMLVFEGSNGPAMVPFCSNKTKQNVNCLQHPRVKQQDLRAVPKFRDSLQINLGPLISRYTLTYPQLAVYKTGEASILHCPDIIHVMLVCALFADTQETINPFGNMVACSA